MGHVPPFDCLDPQKKKKMNFLFLLSLSTFSFFQVGSLPSNFYNTLVTLPLYVDKTEMLRYVFDQNSTNQTDVPYYFINCPRSFGKSVNLGMIYTFASFVYTPDGHPRSPRDTRAHNIFKKLNISKHENFMSEHLARYPVIYLDLIGVGTLITSTEATIADMNSVLWFELDHFHQLKTVNSTQNPYNITNDEIRFMDKLREKKLTIDQVVNSLYILTKVLYKYFNETKVVLLIDHYDYAAFKSPSTINSHALSVYEIINDMIAQTLILGRPYLKSAVICGISTLSYSLDKVLALTTRHYAFLDDHEFTPYFGITESELNALFDKYKCSENERQAVRRQYEGYKTVSKQMTIYNSQSIFQYFLKRGLKLPDKFPIEKSSWRKVDAPGCLAPYLKHAEFRAKFLQLLDNSTIELKIEKTHQTRALYYLEELRDRNFTRIDDDNVYLNTFFVDMFELGFLSHGPKENSYIIPNNEIREILQQELRIYKDLYETKGTPEIETTTAESFIITLS